MSENAQSDGSPTHQHPGGDTSLNNISLEDSANNSIIGKVKSRVSSILPNRLSKWFSPSTKLQNDSLNGSLSTSLPARRRRRIEVEAEESYEEEDMRRDGEGHEMNLGRDNDEEENDDDDEESQNSDEEYMSSGIIKETKRDLNVERQPPAKRSRLNIDTRDSPLIARHQPLLSSTPAVGSTYLRNTSSTSPLLSRTPYQRLTHLNLYANQSNKEPAFNFGPQKELKTNKFNTDIIELISNPLEYEEKHTQSTNAFEDNRHIRSSRKSLNIRPASRLSDAERVYSNAGPLKRQPLSTAKVDSITNYSTTVPRTSTIIQEESDEYDNQQCEEGPSGKSNEGNANTYNGRIEESNNAVATNKRPKLINGTSLTTAGPIIAESNEAIIIDSASESGESGSDNLKGNLSNTQRKTGLFNMSTSGSVNTRNSSRTSSFGNGLNFYSHLEGRKSLFSGPNNGKSESLNNSTLSLTSLNRRQFNASIYGSTSALSDSRLLNTFSPFYKGKTTYGGAAAYNKYSVGAGASAVRITPTLIRPTSSLSTLSSSSNSLANNITQVGESSTISSTAKRILDLINDFATPLSEAKKMANSLKTNPNTQIPLQAKSRLNDSDLNASRAMRLSQVRTPYCRPAVILQPSGNASGRGTVGGLLPPVKELQVPTMSQLLQMKKIQNSTENARKVTQNTGPNIGTSEYSLPEATVVKTVSNSGVDQDKQKHTNKIRSKVTNTLRPSAASKGLQDEEPPPPVNLPNIAFPLMQSIPKIDIQINKISVSSSSTPSQSNTLTLTSNSESSIVASAKTTSFAFNSTTNKNLTQTPTFTTDSNILTTNSNQSTSVKPITTSKCVHTYKFSEPLQIGSVTTTLTQSLTENDINKYKFSSPLDVTLPTPLDSVATNNTQPKQPQLKEGSCLDALNKPLSLPNQSKANSSNTLAINVGFGNQFKKSSNEWECDACMVRNKSDVSKCVACETPRKQNSPASVTVTTVASTSATPSFGLQFKKSSDEWECDTCMIRNKQENTKCVACETIRKGTTNSLPSLPPIKSSFGDAFKQKSDPWECPTCMISNKNEINECLACQTKKPGSSSKGSALSSSSIPATQFKFGFANTDNNKTAADDVFKTLAAEQKASKWECDACMTRNESNRTKCACCEQPKPGMASAESTSPNSSKFKFGASAAAKFSFGFGAVPNTPKEDDKCTSELTNNSDDIPKPSTMIFGIGKTQPASTQIGFQFGIKPAANSTPESKKDEADGKKNLTGFKVGTVTEDGEKSSETSVTVPISSGFTFGSKPLTATSTSTTATLTSATATAMSSNTIAVSTPSVKFSLPSTSTSTTISNNKPTGVAAPTLNFGSSTTATTAGGFSFGSKIESKPTVTVEEKKSLDNFAFKAPTPSNTVTVVSTKSTGFGFGTSTTNISSTISTIGSTNIATTATSSIATSSVKPMFSFSSPVTSTPQAISSQATPAFGGFSFGSNSVVSTKSSTLFSNVTSTSTATTTSASNTTTCLSTSSTTTTTPASTNIFGSFGSSSNASITPIFGSSINPPANNNLSTVSSSTNNSTTTNVPQFGTFTNKTTQNVFGSFGSNNGAGGNSSSTVTSAETKPTLTVFGNVAPTSTSQSSQSSSGGFVFGSKPSSNNTTLVSATSTTSSVTSTSTTWPKNSFVFGSLTPATTSTTNDNKETTKPSLFGSFSSPNSAANNQQQTSSIFGAPSTNIASSSSALSGTLASGSTSSSTNLFGSNSAPAATSIFGANSSGNAVTPAPAFGSSPFGGAASSTSATPTFGSTAASGATTFGGFGGATSSSSTTNVTEIKKPEAAFNFGTAAATQSTSGGFNFGSTSTKPAFNFGSSATTQQPTFNFTGSSESQNSTKPFQFGATPSAPVFNFNRGALEGTPNAPFQFNAGAAPVSSNIFAPTPTPGAQSAQQAKRKIRAPIRRVTQR